MRPGAARLLAFAALLLLPRPAPAQEPEARATVVRNFTLDGELTEREWKDVPALVLSEANLVRPEEGNLSRHWAGEADLSGVLHLAFTATDLVLAGRVRDDVSTINPNPSAWWAGDEIELFLDLDLSSEEAAPDVYNGDDYQILLFPLADGPRFGVIAAPGYKGPGDGGFDGVRVASRRLVDEEGRYQGYTFEAALPIANFPALSLRQGQRIGFDLALSDADGEYVQKTYMTLSGRGLLFSDPRRFGRLVIAESRPSPDEEPAAGGSRWVEPGLILFCALLALILLWRYRRRVTAIAEIAVRTKLALTLLFLGLLVLSRVLPDAIGEARTTRTWDRLDRDVTLLREALAEADAEWVLGGPQGSPEPARIGAFLTRGDALPPERFEYRTVFLRPAALSLTEGDTPVIDYARRLPAGEEASFAPPEARPATAVALVYHFEPDPAARTPVTDGETVASVRLVSESGETQEFPLRYGREVADHGTADPVALPAPGLSVAWRDTGARTHAIEYHLPADPATRLARVLVGPSSTGGTFVVHGATLLSPGEPEPLPLLTTTRRGVTANVWQDRPRGTSVVLSGANRSFRLPLPVPADRVWVFLAKGAPEPGKPADSADLDLLSLALTTGDGRRLDPVVLRNGVHLDSEALHSNSHPPEFASPIAWQWTTAGAVTLHRDAVVLEPRDAPATVFEAAFLGTNDTVILAGLTVGTVVAHRVGRDLKHLAYREADGTYALGPAAQSELSGTALTWYRAGRAVWTGLPDDLGRESLLGSSLPLAAGPADLETGTPVHVERTLGSSRYLAAFLPLRRGGGDVLEIARPAPTATDLMAYSALAFWVLLALFLLGVLLLIADLLSLVTRLRTKLTVGFAVAAVVPLVFLFLGLSGILEREASRAEMTSLLEQLRLVRDQMVQMRDEIRQCARDVLEDPRLAEALASLPDREAYAAGTETAVLRLAERPATRPGDVRITVEDRFSVDRDRGPRRFPLGSPVPPVSTTLSPANDLRYRYSVLAFEGTASRAVLDGRRTVFVEYAVGPEFLRDLKGRFGTRFELLLFSPRGYPCAGTLELPGGAAARGQVRERREVRAEIELNGAPAVREEVLAGGPYTVIYDLLRTETGAPAALIGVALPRREFLAARRAVANLFVLLGALILILEAIVGAILTRRITDPLTSLARGVRAVAKGRLKTRVAITVADEIGTLAELFNRMTSELERRIGELGKLNTAVRSLSGSLDRELVLEHAIAALDEAVAPADGVAILLRTDGEAEIAAGRRGGKPLPAARFRVADGPVAAALAASTPALVTALDAEYAARPELAAEQAALAAPTAAAVVPFAAGREVRGAVLVLYDRSDARPPEGVLEFLSTMAQQVAIALENARLYKLAIEDPASGLYVHSYFLARLREETDRAIAAGRPLALLLVSLDELDRVYETYGPAEGDHVLTLAVARLRTATRGMHVMARADRSTVEIMLPETEKEEAFAVAREIRRALTKGAERLASDPGRTIRFRPSVALASCPEDARSAEFLLAEARRALYMAVTDRAATGLVESGREAERTETRVEGQGKFIFRSPKILELLETVNRIAQSDVPILIQGETGVGKEVIADLVHEKSTRQDKALVKVNCAALPETLLESELFGYERGAFTGADRRKPGRFELADGGTIFLDEIGEMPPQTQVKLLRVLQDHQVERLGSTAPMHVDVRVIAATNRDLLAAIREGRFREDLYFRLNVVSLAIPPLRARKEDIPALVDHFLTTFARRHRTAVRRLSPAAMDLLFAHSWPGNVRELRNTIERALVVARGEEVQPDEIVFPDLVRAAAPPPVAPSPAAPAGPSAGEPTPATGEPLNIRQVSLLEILSRRETITNREFADLLGISVRTGNRDLSDLIERGLIEQVGQRRGAVYRRIAREPHRAS